LGLFPGEKGTVQGQNLKRKKISGPRTGKKKRDDEVPKRHQYPSQLPSNEKKKIEGESPPKPKKKKKKKEIGRPFKSEFLGRVRKRRTSRDSNIRGGSLPGVIGRHE